MDHLTRKKTEPSPPSYSPETKKTEKTENLWHRTVNLITQTFLPGAHKEKMDISLPETTLEQREFERGQKGEEAIEEPGFFRKIFGGFLYKKEELTEELTHEEKELQTNILDSLTDKDSLLAENIRNNTGNIVNNAEAYFQEKIVQELQKLTSFQDAVIEKNKDNYNFVLNFLKEKINSGLFSTFDKSEFNQKFFEENGLEFMIKALTDNREKTDLFFVIDYLCKENPKFKKAFDSLKKDTEEYFYELRKSKRDPKDIEYQKAIIRYSELEALQEAIHELEPHKWEDLDANFESAFGEEMNQLQSYFKEKEAQEFDKLFQELAHTLFVNDKEFQKARVVIDNRLYQAGNEINIGQLYFNDPEFRSAYNLISARFQAVEKMLGLEWRKAEKEPLISVSDFAKETAKELLGDVSQVVQDNKGKLLLSPAVVVGTAVFGIQATAIGYGVLAIGRRVLPAMKKVLVESNLLFDYKAAQEDRKVRASFLQHVFLEAPTEEQKKRALDFLLDKNLLFKEDVDSSLAQYLKEQNIDIATLPQLSKYRETREQFKALMKDAFPDPMILKKLVESLMEQNLVYLEDFKTEGKQWSDAEIEKILPSGKKTSDLATLQSAKELRNPSLFLLKGGTHLTPTQKLGELEQLHKKGILFKEDIARLRDKKVATDEEIAEFLKKNNINLYDLPSLETYYYKTNVTLKQQEDIKRAPYLEILNNKTSSDEVKLLTLKKMHLEGVCFLDDLESKNLSPALITNFKDFVSSRSIKPEDRKKMHDEAKTGQGILDKHETILKSLFSTEEEKMDSLLELEMEGLLSKEHKDMISKPTLIRYNALYLQKASGMTDKLVNSHDHYQYGVYDRLVKLNNMIGDSVKEQIRQNPGKLAAAVLFTAGGGWTTIAGAAFVGDIAGVIWRKEHVAKIIQGPMEDVGGAIDLGIKAKDFGTEMVAQVVSDFTDIPAKNIHDWIITKMPSNNQIKQGASYALNKTIGAVKWGVLGSSLGYWLGGTFGLKVGLGLGSFFGLCATNGKVNQIPAGGFERAVNFTAVGALVGAVVPVIAAGVALGLTLAGIIGSTVGLGIATGGLGLIIPLIIFGIYAGFVIAGYTGKDLVDKTDPIIDELGRYEPLNLEEAGVYLV
ncbi:MAG: hypothetical protein C5B43_00700 [Verrucomicrobia bacterium]|nr:MAG: hypothetical protein C5B43_00700 [Verrucomicrobiota bacterium]